MMRICISGEPSKIFFNRASRQCLRVVAMPSPAVQKSCEALNHLLYIMLY